MLLTVFIALQVGLYATDNQMYMNQVYIGLENMVFLLWQDFKTINALIYYKL